MDNTALKELMFSSISSLMENREYFYYSALGSDYSHWTEEGEKVVLGYLALLGPKIIKNKKLELEDKAKELMLDIIKN
jgi:hypothetical protein